MNSIVFENVELYVKHFEKDNGDKTVALSTKINRKGKDGEYIFSYLPIIKVLDTEMSYYDSRELKDNFVYKANINGSLSIAKSKYGIKYSVYARKIEILDNGTDIQQK